MITNWPWKVGVDDEECVKICSEDDQVGQKIKISEIRKWDVLVRKCG